MLLMRDKQDSANRFLALFGICFERSKWQTLTFLWKKKKKKNAPDNPTAIFESQRPFCRLPVQRLSMMSRMLLVFHLSSRYTPGPSLRDYRHRRLLPQPPQSHAAAAQSTSRRQTKTQRLSAAAAGEQRTPRVRTVRVEKSQKSVDLTDGVYAYI